MGEGSLMVEQSLFHAIDGGSTPTPSLHDIKGFRVFPVTWEDGVRILAKFHYRKSSIGGSIKWCFGLFCDGRIIGISAFGDLRHPDKYNDGGKIVVTELRRLALIDDAPKNSESYFIAKSMWYLRKHTNVQRVISYADGSVGHTGTIYKASNFTLIGKTAPSQVLLYKGREYHMRSLTINRPYAAVLQSALKNGEAVVKRGEGKFIYQYDFPHNPNQSQRRDDSPMPTQLLLGDD